MTDLALDAAGWAEALSPLLPVYQPAPGLYLAQGPRLLPSWFLAALAPALARGRGLVWLDAGNGFDAYGMSYAARASGMDPRAALRRVKLARPFNLFQLETMLHKTLPASWHGEPVVLSDPFALLYDEDVPLKEARRVFASVLEGLRRLPAVWMTLAVSRRAPAGREGWLGELADRACASAALAPAGAHWRLQREALLPA